MAEENYVQVNVYINEQRNDKQDFVSPVSLHNFFLLLECAARTHPRLQALVSLPPIFADSRSRELGHRFPTPGAVWLAASRHRSKEKRNIR